MGIGRIGSVLGGMTVGWMPALGWGLPVVFAIVGIRTLIAAVCMSATSLRPSEVVPER